MCGFYYRPSSISFRVRKCCNRPFILRSKAWLGFVQKSTFHCQKANWILFLVWSLLLRQLGEVGWDAIDYDKWFLCRIIGLWWSKATVKWTSMQWSFLNKTNNLMGKAWQIYSQDNRHIRVHNFITLINSSEWHYDRPQLVLLLFCWWETNQKNLSNRKRKNKKKKLK